MNINVMNVILSELRKVDSKCYYEYAPSNATFPFAVFRIPSSFQLEGRTENLILEIDCYSNLGANITTLETLVDNIAKAFHKKYYLDANMALTFNKESILQIPETEPLRRRKINFTVRYYSREA